MKTLVLFFLCVRFFYLLNNHQIYYVLQTFERIFQGMQNKTVSPKTRVIVVDITSLPLLIYLISDLMYLLFTIYLLFSDAYWQPGAMLFIITSLETYAYHLRVDYTYDEDEQGFIYPKTWNRCLLSGMTIYILTKMYISL